LTHGKRIVAFLTLFAVLFSMAGMAAANFPDVAGTRFAASTDRLLRLGILVGDPDGNFYPNREVTRAEMVKMVISAKGLLHQVAGLAGTAAFPDSANHWASGYIALAKNLGIVNGFPDGTFKPQDRVTYAQAAKMLLEATGNGPDGGFVWPDNYMSVALAKGMFQGIPTTAANVPAIRGDCAMMTARSIDHISNPRTGATLAQTVFGSVASLALTPTQTTYTPVGAAVQFAAVPKNSVGQPLIGLPIGWMSSNPATASITQDGLFGSPVAGTYLVTAASGGFVETATVGVYGTATALRATPSATQVSATGANKVQIVVEVVDAAGVRVASNSAAVVTMTHAEDNGAVTLGETITKVVNGVAAFEVTSTSNEDRSDRLEFTAEGLSKALVTISTVSQVATSIELVATPQAVQANSVTSTEITARILDQSGAQMTSGVIPLTFTVSGPGTFAGGVTAPIDTVAAAGEASVHVFSVQAEPGTISVRASSPGLPNGQISILSYLAGSPAAIRANITDNVVQACTTGPDADMASLAVELVDGYGNLTTRATDLDLTATLANGESLASIGLDVSGDLTINAGQSETGQLRILAAADNAGLAGVHTVKLTPGDTSLPPITFAVTVVPGEPAALTVSHPNNVMLPVTAPSLTVGVQVLDNAGNEVRTGGLTISAGWEDLGDANQGTPTINGTVNPPADPTASGAVSVATNAGGLATFSFVAQGYVGDEYRLSFDLDAITAETGPIMIVDSIAAQMSLRFASTQGTTITQLKADRSQVGFVEVTVRDGSGNPLGGWDITIDFDDQGINVQDVAIVSGDLVTAYAHGSVTVRTVLDPGGDLNGKALVAFRGAKADNSLAVTASAQGLASPLTRSAAFRVVRGTALAGVVVLTETGIAADALDVVGDVPYLLRLTPVDNGGNAMVAPVDVAVLIDPITGLYSTGVGGQFRETPTGTALATGAMVTIPRATTAKDVYYVQPGTAQGVEIGVDPNDGAYLAYVFDAALVNYMAGPPEQNTITLTVRDGSGNPVPGLRLEMSVTEGSLSVTSVTTGSDGKASVVWTSGTGGQLTVTAPDAVLGGGGVLEQVLLWSTP